MANWDELGSAFGVPAGTYKFRMLYEDSVIVPVGSTPNKFDLFAVAPSRPSAHRLRAGMKRINMVACYCSIYGDCKVTYQREEHRDSVPLVQETASWLKTILSPGARDTCLKRPEVGFKMPPSFYRRR